MNTKRISNISEAKVLAKFSEQGWAVLVPWGDTEPYDLVIDRGSGFESVQVKTARYLPTKEGLEFKTYSMTGGRGYQRTKLQYFGKVDLYAAYFPPLDSVYLVPVDSSKSSISLRLTATKNNQTKGIRMASDYLVR